MQILFYSPNFLPLTGGLEHVVRDWAYGLTERGHRVVVVCTTNSDMPDAFPFTVKRNIDNFEVWRIARRSDVIVQFNVSLKGILPCILSFRPLIISQHTTNLDIDGRPFPMARIKNFIANWIARANTACSNYVSNYFRNVTVIHSPYAEDVFVNMSIQRVKDVVFLGRLVSDKGCDILLRAIGHLKRVCARVVSVTIVGQGPELDALSALAKSENIDGQIAFVGNVRGAALATLLNQHKIMVVPSRWQEPFGIVALEGLACGCDVIASKVGGLPEAAGPFGSYFENENPVDLANIILEKLGKGDMTSARDIDEYLKSFTKRASVEKFEALLKSVA